MAGSSSVGRAAMAGGISGAVAALVLLIVAAALVARLAPKLMPRMIGRMMAESGCSKQMRACMEKCGCLRSDAGTAGEPGEGF